MRSVFVLAILLCISRLSIGQNVYFTDSVSHYLIVIQKGDWVKYKKLESKRLFHKDIREGLIIDVNDSVFTLVEIKSAFHKKKTDTLFIRWSELQSITPINFFQHAGFQLAHALIWSGISLGTIFIIGSSWPVIIGSILVFEPISYFSYRCFDQCLFPLNRLAWAHGRWQKVSLEELRKQIR